MLSLEGEVEGTVFILLYGMYGRESCRLGAHPAIGLGQSSPLLENTWVSLGKHSVRKGQWCILNYACLGNCVGLFFFSFLWSYTRKCLSLGISACLLRILVMKVLRLWGFPYIKISRCWLVLWEHWREGEFPCCHACKVSTGRGCSPVLCGE